MSDAIQNKFTIIKGFSKYGISEDGVVIELKTETIVTPTRHVRGYMSVELCPYGRTLSGTKKPNLAKLVLTTFNPLPHDKISQFVSVNYLNGDDTDVRLNNLEWDFSVYIPGLIPGINISRTGFVRVPGYEYLEINGDGCVQLGGFKLLVAYLHDNGYYYVTVEHDGKKYPLLVHWLLALTFLEHPVDVSGIVINHKNGNTLDNSLSNLEWTTYSGNSLHAYETGLRNDNKPVVVMDVKTRKTQRHYSLGAFCRAHALESGTIWNRLRYNRPLTPYMGYYIKYEDDSRLWPEEDFIMGRKSGVAEKVKIINLKTREELLFDSISLAAIHLGVNTSSVSYQVRKSTPTIYKGYCIKSASDNSEWPNLIVPKELCLSEHHSL